MVISLFFLKIQSGQFLSNLQSFFEFLFLRVGKIWLFGKLGFVGWLERLANVPNERWQKKLKMREG
jgi:hypothetical protein